MADPRNDASSRMPRADDPENRFNCFNCLGYVSPGPVQEQPRTPLSCGSEYNCFPQPPSCSNAPSQCSQCTAFAHCAGTSPGTNCVNMPLLCITCMEYAHCATPPPPSPSPPPPAPPPFPPSLTLSGQGCSNGYDHCNGCQVNQVYEPRGFTADGRAYYQGVSATNVYIYYDSNCGGVSDPPNWRIGWMVGCSAPNTTASSNLASTSHTSGCCYHAHVRGADTTQDPPSGAGSWGQWCRPWD